MMSKNYINYIIGLQIFITLRLEFFPFKCYIINIILKKYFKKTLLIIGYLL